MNVGGYPEKKRAERKQTDCGGKHAARPESIRHPAADGNEYRETQGVAGKHRFHAERSHLQSRRDGGHGGIQNGGVERLHEERDCDQPRQQSLAEWARCHYVTVADSSEGSRLLFVGAAVRVSAATGMAMTAGVSPASRMTGRFRSGVMRR